MGRITSAVARINSRSRYTSQYCPAVSDSRSISLMSLKVITCIFPPTTPVSSLENLVMRLFSLIAELKQLAVCEIITISI